MKPYQEASKIDKTIGKLLGAHPITKKSAIDWMNFARVIETTANILHRRALLIYQQKEDDEIIYQIGQSKAIRKVIEKVGKEMGVIK